MVLHKKRTYLEELPDPEYRRPDELFDIRHTAQVTISEVSQTNEKTQLVMCLADPLNLLDPLAFLLIIDRSANLEDLQRRDSQQGLESEAEGRQHDIKAIVLDSLGNENRVSYAIQMQGKEYLHKGIEINLVICVQGTIDYWQSNRGSILSL